MGTLTIIGCHLHVHRHQINMFLSSPRKGKKGLLRPNVQSRDSGVEAGAENMLLFKQITILCTGYIHVCIVRFDLGWGRENRISHLIT